MSKKYSEIISRELLIRLKLHDLPAYRIAQTAGVNPGWLSKAIHGIETIKPRDPRLIAIGKVLGMQPLECFRKLPSTNLRYEKKRNDD